MAGYDLSRCESKIWIDAPVADTFDAWTRADRLASWFQHTARNLRDGVESAGAAMAGDAYEWSMSHGHVSRGKYLDVQTGKLVQLTFGPDTGMTFTVRFEPMDRGTMVRLTHENIPPDDPETHADIRSAWTFFLTNLKAWLEHETDLREHSPKRIRTGIVNI